MARDLDLLWDVSTGALTFNRETGNYVKRGETLTISVTIQSNGASSTSIPANAVCTLKPVNNYSTVLATWSAFAQVGSTNVFTASSALTSAAISTLLGTTVEQWNCVFDFAGDGVNESDTLAMVLKNNVSRSDDTAPNALMTRNDFIVTNGTGLLVNVGAGILPTGARVAAQSGIAIVNGTNYVELNASGVASANAIGFTDTYSPLAVVIASAGAITSNDDDRRPWINTKGGAGGGGSGDVVGPAGATDGNVAVFDGTTGKLLRDGGPLTGTGTVTSVGLTMPGVFSVANSPVTTSATLAVTLATQAANKVWAGPTTGADATPTFRSLVAGDIPALLYDAEGKAFQNISNDSANTFGPLGARWIMSTWLSEDSPRKLRIYYGSDGKTWTPLPENPVYTAPDSQDVGAPAITYYDGKFFVASSGGTYGSGGKILIISSPDLVNWTLVTTLTYTGLFSGQNYAWPPKWFLDNNGDVRLYFTAVNSVTLEQQVWTTKATNRALTAWEAPQHVALTGGDPSGWARDAFVFKTAETYRMVYVAVNNDGGFVAKQASSTNAVTGWEDGADAVAGYEALSVVPLPDGRWRVYAETSDSSPDGLVFGESTSGTVGLLASLLTPTTLSPAVARHHGSVIRIGISDPERMGMPHRYDPQKVTITGGSISNTALGLSVGFGSGLFANYVPETGDSFGVHLLTTATTGITGNAVSVITSSVNGLIVLGQRTAINTVVPWLTLSNSSITTPHGINGGGSLTLGSNGGTGGSIVLNGSTSGSATVNVSATGALNLPSGTTVNSVAFGSGAFAAAFDPASPGAIGGTTPNTVAMTSGTFTGSFKSTTALATPSALAATQFTAFASAASGATIMGYGTTADVTLKNRAGTDVLTVGPNTTAVTLPGTITAASFNTGSINATSFYITSGGTNDMLRFSSPTNFYFGGSNSL